MKIENVVEENIILRTALERIASERTVQPGSYLDLINGSGEEVPTRAATIAIEALEAWSKCSLIKQ